MAPEISIIMPTYKVEKYIAESIESVKKQTVDPSRYELIIFDDNSWDSTNQVIKRSIKNMNNAKHYRRGKNMGAAITRNEAINQSEGRLIALLDADDLLEPHAIESTLKFMNENPKVEYSYSKHRRIDENGQFIEDRPCQPYSFEDLFHYNFVGPIKCFTKELHRKIGGFNPSILYGQDWDHALSSALELQEGQFKQNPEFLYKYRIRANSITTSKEKERSELIKKFLTEKLSQRGISARVYRSHKTDAGYNYYDWRTQNEKTE